jgi:hypothetical protein
MDLIGLAGYLNVLLLFSILSLERGHFVLARLSVVSDRCSLVALTVSKVTRNIIISEYFHVKIAARAPRSIVS